MAHVARPLVLAGGLDPAEFETVFACHPRYRRFLDHQPWQTVPLQSIGSEQFLASLARGSPLYDAPTLRRYVHEDLELIRRFEPDLVVGDFRISLSVSARLAGVPYASITNAYWSPYCIRQDFPLPQLPMTKLLPIPLARAIFSSVMPLAMAVHCKPMNDLRREHGLPSLGRDLRRVYADADHVLYADPAILFPTHPLPENHRFIGPILWSPPIAKPAWWDEIPTSRPVVYVTLGSSGQVRTTAKVLAALAQLPLTVMASTAGADIPLDLPANALAADYLPGTEAAALSSLVICNGGSPTSQQALAAGVPVLCIASNTDQFLNAAALVEAGCGGLLRADRIKSDSLRSIAMALLSSDAARRSAQRLQGEFARYRPEREFAALARSVCSFN